MSHSFKFGFGDEDMEVDDIAEDSTPQKGNEPIAEGDPKPGIAPCEYALDETLAALPSRIEYNTIVLHATENGATTLPRRELFDIRAQLMAEDSSTSEAQAGLSMDDISPNVYEGGFKTWECSVDLANYLLLQRTDRSAFMNSPYHIIELGAGTALPTQVCFHYLLSSPPIPHPPRRTLVLTDYNPSVLHLATAPNLLLTYALLADLIPPGPGDLQITPALLSSFKQNLGERNIYLRFIAGGWGTELASLLVSSLNTSSSLGSRPADSLILASETIYSVHSTFAFTTCLMEIVRRCEENRARANALVAAKNVYFGVGGGVAEFRNMLNSQDGDSKVFWETEGMGNGVGRCILEVTPKTR